MSESAHETPGLPTIIRPQERLRDLDDEPELLPSVDPVGDPDGEALVPMPRMRRIRSRRGLGLSRNVARHVLQLPFMGLTMLEPGRFIVRARKRDGHKCVVFVHGFAGHKGNFRPMRTFFALRGRTRTYATTFPRWLSIHDAADELRLFLRKVAQENALGHGDIEIVAHSMGGLISRVAMFDEQTARRVGTIVTLGTPHRGTIAAELFPKRLAAELRRTAPLFQRLEAQLPWAGPPALPRLVSIVSENDLLLQPMSAGIVPGADNVQENRFTHYDFVLAPSAWRCVWDTLSPERPRLLNE